MLISQFEGREFELNRGHLFKGFGKNFTQSKFSNTVTSITGEFSATKMKIAMYSTTKTQIT